MPESYCPECLDSASLDGAYCDRCGERLIQPTTKPDRCDYTAVKYDQGIDPNAHP
jgi:hypothetical protein